MKFSTRTFAAIFAAAGVFAGMIAAPASSQAQTFNLPTSSIPLSSSLPTPQQPGIPSTPGTQHRPSTPGTPGAPSKPSTPSNVEAKRVAVIAETNKFRAQQGAQPLQSNPALNAEAQRRAEELARNNAFHHFELGSLVANHGGVGENIFQLSDGFDFAPTIVRGWANSPGHHANMANEQATQTGIGIAKGRDGNWRVLALYSER